MRRERLERCFDLCADKAWRVAVHWVGDSHEAFDVVQQAFVIAAGKPERIPHDDPWPWFRQVVINEARNTRRKHKPTPSEQENRMPDPAPGPEQQLSREESSAELQRALDTLPEREREAIVLTHLGGMTHAEAADALGIPVKTLSSHVSRGMERLKHKLGSKGETLLASVGAAPLALPPGGWEGALAAWKASAFAALTETATGTAVAAGAILMKKTLIAAGMVAALGIGLGGGVILNQQLADPPARPETSASVEGAPLDDAGGGPLQGDETDGNGSADRSTSIKLDAARAAESRALKAADDLREELREAEAERDVFKDKVERLEDELAPIRAEQAERGPTFTYGKHGQIEGVTGSNWKELAGASHEVIRNLRALREHQIKGEQAPREVFLAIQENTEKMRTYEYDTIGVLPTWAKHNGELTHPISHSNLIASELKTVGLPLTEAQVAQIEKLGLQWEADYEAAQKRYNDSTPRVEKMLDEYTLKGAFVDAVWDVLTPEQLEHFVDPNWHHVAHVDLYCTSLMIIHTSPVVTGADIGEIRGKLQNMLVETYEIGEDQVEALGPILDTWQSDVGAIVTPVPKTHATLYTFEQGKTAAQATAKLVRSIRDYGMLSEEGRAKLLDAYTVYIPRVVAAE